ncbi:MAG: hypothetical protein GF350_17310 [Chitinivibrionales bacterium]|nr:hypothetical protein [Chitinivibrionales bacterium]
MANQLTYNLETGYVFIADNGTIIRTVLGSCVAVCLWDSARMAGGLDWIYR